MPSADEEVLPVIKGTFCPTNMDASEFSVVIKLGVAKILFCVSASKAVKRAPIFGTSVAPGPIEMTLPVTLDNCPFAPKELKFVPALSVKLPTPSFPLDPENCNPSRFVV